MKNDYRKLIFVSENNNNKYYEMQWDGGSTFFVKYGRIDVTAQTGTYSYSMWNSKYREKIKKGYIDITDKVTIQVENNNEKEIYVDIKEKIVNDFIIKMKEYTDKLVSNTYSTKAESVSQKQVDEAQKLIDEINEMGTKSINIINQKLIELYTVIPRRMNKVKDYLTPNIRLDIHMKQEQDNLDAIASQVSMIAPKKRKKNTKSINILEKIGITIKEVKSNKDIQYIIDQCDNRIGRKIKAIFEINNKKENKIFKTWLDNQKNKQTKILIHGTRNTSVIPILEMGLKIRPFGNFQFSGKVYGDGNYFSETVQKSLNYTGNNSDKVLLIYEVHIGNPFTYSGWYTGNSFKLNYKNLKDRGFDSTFVSAGNGLLNSEIIAYKEEQAKIKYILWLN